MIRYTTPTLTLKVPLDLSNAEVYVSLEQANKKTHIKIDPKNIHVCNDETKIYLPLSQNDTGSLKSGSSVSMQINWIFANGKRDATNKRSFTVTDNMLDEVVEYGN